VWDNCIYGQKATRITNNDVGGITAFSNKREEGEREKEGKKRKTQRKEQLNRAAQWQRRPGQRQFPSRYSP
jgi:hypothetical protein